MEMSIPETIKKCPKCGKNYKGHPAMSRVDNKTLICPLCGTREALESIGISKEEQDEIIGTIVNSVMENEKEQECLE